jgi:hypothetical protein
MMLRAAVGLCVLPLAAPQATDCTDGASCTTACRELGASPSSERAPLATSTPHFQLTTERPRGPQVFRSKLRVSPRTTLGRQLPRGYNPALHALLSALRRGTL